MLSIAKAHHVPSLKRMASNFFNSSPYNTLPLDENKRDQLIHGLMNANLSEATVIVYEANGQPIGCIAGQVSTILFNNNRVASEVMWWVDPEHRKSKAGMKLLKAFESWAVYAKCDVIHMVCLAEEHGDVLDKLYTRLGYKQTERHYMKEI
jgi:GNAT superfamily N-acetyltransferase